MSNLPALVLIDVQANMFDPVHPVHDAEGLIERLGLLLARAREAHAPIVFVRNNGGAGDPDLHGTPGWELHRSFVPEPGDLVLDKTTCDAFASTTLGEELHTRGVTRLVIAGLQSDYCIRETTLGALGLGLEAILVGDGHSTYAANARSAPEISAAINAELTDRARLLKANEVQFG